jgi:hypothetical protein
MKNITIGLTGILLMLLTSCEKEQARTMGDHPLVAAWIWKHSIGGIAGQTVSPSSNATVLLNFYSDYTYIAKVNGQTAAQGTFALAANGNSTVIQFDKTISADKLLLQKDQRLSKLEDGQLIINDNNISDGYGHYFDQVK